MAWPPGVLPINRTNATTQQDTHPADHNAVNQAVNDIVPQVQALLANKPAFWVQANQPGQAIGAGADGTIAWATVNNPAWGVAGATSLVVPAGGDGVYVVSAKLTSPPPPGPATTNLTVALAGVSFNGYQHATYETQCSVAVVGTLAAGQAVGVGVHSGHSSSQSYGVLITVARIAPLT